MNSGCRRALQRSNRVRLKADCVVLLDRLAARYGQHFTHHELAQIAEIRMRLAPPTGVKAPIVLTGYTK